MEYTNPVVSGFYPDPSVCYAEGYFYLVCSSFEYFPGLPLFKSRNLVDWEQIGHCITRKSQLDLTGVAASGGLFAPTIRYHEGRFYVVVTNTSGDGNFYLYTDDIDGEWSEPVNVARGGIDPSLLFDDGKVYFMSNGEDDDGENGISLCEINIETGEILNRAKCISKGNGGRFLEAPHLYHIGNYYYLLVAEGGTEYGHMECIFRSRDPYGPYETCPHNPILTNRNLGTYQIQGAGHADLVQDEAGQWWLLHLAFRQMDTWRPYHQLGREVYLVPAFWTEDGWLRIGTDGTCRSHYLVDNGTCKVLGEPEYPSYRWRLKLKEACFLRCPNYNNYRFTDEKHFALKGVVDTIGSTGNITFVGMRQREFKGVMELLLDTETMGKGQQSGITAYLSESSHYDLVVTKQEKDVFVQCVLYIGNMPVYQEKLKLDGGNAALKIESEAQTYSFFAGSEEGAYVKLGGADAKYLTSEVAEGFTGVVLAAYCGADEKGESSFVEFTVL